MTFQCRASGVSHSEVVNGEKNGSWMQIQVFQCRASGVSHSEEYITTPAKRLIQNSFNAVRPAFHIRRSPQDIRKGLTAVVSMPCVRRFTFGVANAYDANDLDDEGFNAVRPAFHIRRDSTGAGNSASPFGFNAVRPAFHIRSAVT